MFKWKNRVPFFAWLKIKWAVGNRDYGRKKMHEKNWKWHNESIAFNIFFHFLPFCLLYSSLFLHFQLKIKMQNYSLANKYCVCTWNWKFCADSISLPWKSSVLCVCDRICSCVAYYNIHIQFAKTFELKQRSSHHTKKSFSNMLNILVKTM